MKIGIFISESSHDATGSTFRHSQLTIQRHLSIIISSASFSNKQVVWLTINYYFKTENHPFPFPYSTAIIPIADNWFLYVHMH